MKKLFKLILFLYILNLSAFSQYIFEKVGSFSYGNKENLIGIRKETDGIYGPTGFLNSRGILYILDTENSKVKMISEKGEFIKSINTQPFSHDFYIDKGTLYILDINGITSYDLTSSSVLNYKKNNIKLNKFENNSLKYELTKLNSATAEFSHISSNENLSIRFKIIENSNKLASINLIDIDSYNNYYFDEEVFVSEVPCMIDRFILKYNRSGELIQKIKLPDIYYCKLDKDISVTPEGDIYHIIANKESLEIICWKNTGSTYSKDIVLTYPKEFDGRYHYNNEVNDRVEGSKADETFESVPHENKLLVDREESVQIADTYVQHSWACQQKNLSNGAITAPDGKNVKTPEWITIGVNQKVPYQWGGFSTISQFDQGILNGKFAGDNVCTGNGSSSAVGVDCSGFVSRCWKLSSHYSTSMMPAIMLSLNSWAELRKGDAIHKVGHVRMSVMNNPNGTVNLVESSGADWRVSYRSYNFNNLSGYSPYRYKNMVEPQTGISEKIEIKEYHLFDNYPNPFNPNTTIKFIIPNSGKTTLKIYSVLGKEVKTLVAQNLSAGEYSYKWNSENNPSGVYFYEIISCGFRAIKKLILLK